MVAIFAHVLARGKKDDCSNKMLGDGINPTGRTDLAPVAKERMFSSVMENLQIVSSLGLLVQYNLANLLKSDMYAYRLGTEAAKVKLAAQNLN